MAKSYNETLLINSYSHRAKPVYNSCTGRYSCTPKQQPIYFFLENKGQWPKDVLFKSKMSGGNLWLQTNKLIYHLQDFSSLRENHFSRSQQSSTSIKEKLIHLNFKNCNPISEIQKTKKANPTTTTLLVTTPKSGPLMFMVILMYP